MNAKIPQPLQEFYDKRKDSISSMKNDKNLQDLGVKIMRDSGPHNYAYNFDCQ